MYLNRRDFLKQAAVIAGTAFAGGFSIVCCTKQNEIISKTWHLNPGFRLEEISQNEIKLFTNLGNGEKIEHNFTDIEADLFRKIAAEQDLNFALKPFAKKYNLSDKECQQQILKFLSEYNEAKLIYSGDKMLVKIVEADK